MGRDAKPKPPLNEEERKRAPQLLQGLTEAAERRAEVLRAARSLEASLQSSIEYAAVGAQDPDLAFVFDSLGVEPDTEIVEAVFEEAKARDEHRLELLYAEVLYVKDEKRSVEGLRRLVRDLSLERSFVLLKKAISSGKNLSRRSVYVALAARTIHKQLVPDSTLPELRRRIEDALRSDEARLVQSPEGGRWGTAHAAAAEVLSQVVGLKSGDHIERRLRELGDHGDTR